MNAFYADRFNIGGANLRSKWPKDITMISEENNWKINNNCMCIYKNKKQSRI